MSGDESRIPVIVGAGQINDRTDGGEDSLDSLGLMLGALRAAEADARGAWLPQLGSLAIVSQISFPAIGDLTARLPEAVGATPKAVVQSPYPGGDFPIRFLNEAANRIASGEVECAAVVGGEALRTAAKRAAAARSGEQNAIREVSARSARPLRQRYGLVAPADIYPLYEHASRAALGQTFEQAQRESAEIWSRMSDVAAANPDAWIRQRYTPEQILTPSAGNRMIGFPYTKLMVANSSVNQGAAFIVASLAKAKAMGLGEDDVVYIGYGAAAHEPADFLSRDRYDRSASMITSISKALDLNEVSAEQLDFAELYSCFPCIPKLARRVLDWPLERPVTIVGGLTFGGGPIGNYMSHAVACAVRKLRAHGGKGLLFANGGFANTNHTILLSSTPTRARLPHSFDFQAESDAMRGPLPQLIEEYAGPATIETFTVPYDRSGQPRFGTIVARTPDGKRILCGIPIEDVEGIAFLTSGAAEPVGAKGAIVMEDSGAARWRTD